MPNREGGNPRGGSSSGQKDRPGNGQTERQGGQKNGGQGGRQGGQSGNRREQAEDSDED